MGFGEPRRALDHVVMFVSTDVMVDMTTLCRTEIHFSRFLVHLANRDLTIGFEEGGGPSARCSLRVMDLVLSMCLASFVLRDSDRFKCPW